MNFPSQRSREGRFSGLIGLREAESGDGFSLNRYLNLSNFHRYQLGTFFLWGNTPSLERGVFPNQYPALREGLGGKSVSNQTSGDRLHAPTAFPWD